MMKIMSCTCHPNPDGGTYNKYEARHQASTFYVESSMMAGEKIMHLVCTRCVKALKFKNAKQIKEEEK